MLPLGRSNHRKLLLSHSQVQGAGEVLSREVFGDPVSELLIKNASTGQWRHPRPSGQRRRWRAICAPVDQSLARGCVEANDVAINRLASRIDAFSNLCGHDQWQQCRNQNGNEVTHDSMAVVPARPALVVATVCVFTTRVCECERAGQQDCDCENGFHGCLSVFPRAAWVRLKEFRLHEVEHGLHAAFPFGLFFSL